METPLASVPRFIFVESQYLRHEIVSDEPKLGDLISNEFNEDTAIVVTLSRSEMRRMETMTEGKDRGVIYVDRDGFKIIMGRIWSFVDSYKQGSSIRKSVITLVNTLEEGRKQ